jgi:Zn finger protein HypA/HybF involved in hydrogenase expression
MRSSIAIHRFALGLIENARSGVKVTSVGPTIVFSMDGQVGERCERPLDSKRLLCDACGEPMEPEHAHYRCPSCGFILPCCGW